jgi:transcriptional regulator GlxA family with amidase domain
MFSGDSYPGRDDGPIRSSAVKSGKATTTHWGFRDDLRAMGIDVVTDRVVWQGNHVSGAGVSAGIDMALSLTERVTGAGSRKRCSW